MLVKQELGHHWIDQFFVLRAHRRSGLGTRMAQRILDQHHGPWSLSVIKGNHAALAFWRGQVTRAVQVSESAGRRRVRIDFNWTASL